MTAPYRLVLGDALDRAEFAAAEALAWLNLAEIMRTGEVPFYATLPWKPQHSASRGQRKEKS